MPSTRRQLLIAGAGAAAGLAVPGAARARLPLPLGGTLGGGFAPELITVTQTGFAAWWPTDAPADTEVRFARADGRGGWRSLVLERGVTVHVARVDGLEPDTLYRYELRSGGRAMPFDLANPGAFRTLPRLEGALLATIAVVNDLHVGERCSGTITNVGGSSVPPCFTADDYAHRMTAESMAEITALRPDLLVANGDLTDRGRPHEVQRALALLRGTGVQVLVTRGNHDRRLHEPGSPPDGDVLRAAAFPDKGLGDHVLSSVARVGSRVAVLGLDSCDPDSGEGRVDLGGQLDWADRTLAAVRAEGRVPLVAMHHHLATQSNAHHPPPLLFGVRPNRGAPDLLRLLGRHAVPLTLHGHTHRNYLARDPLAPGTWLLENGATKEHPAGYALLAVHEDGIVRTFHRPDGAFTREWNRTTSQQIHGQQPNYCRGTLTSRAFVLRFGDGLPAPGGPVPSLYGPF